MVPITLYSHPCDFSPVELAWPPGHLLLPDRVSSSEVMDGASVIRLQELMTSSWITASLSPWLWCSRQPCRKRLAGQGAEALHGLPPVGEGLVAI